MTQDMKIPDTLYALLERGTTAILATYGSDGYPNAVMTWAASGDPQRIRFGVDLGTSTLANIERENRASLQIIGSENVIFLVKGTTRMVKERIEALPPPHVMCIMEMTPQSVKDQSWMGVTVTPPAYQWTGGNAEKMAEAERSALAEIRDWG